jgi:ATP-dependent DNA ligase
MLAKSSGEVPAGPGWRYEPKWDGFRAIVFRDGDRMTIGSRNGQPLERYFPEILDPLRAALPPRAVVDGELIIAGAHGLDFDALSQRIHPAASRVNQLAASTPSIFVAFDLLAEGEDALLGRPLSERRDRLVSALSQSDQVALTPHTDDRGRATTWFDRFEGAGLDGVVAKRAEGGYAHGERGWLKIKHLRTADCVVGGYREAAGGGVASLLLGLYDAQGVLHYVGHTSGFSAAARVQTLELLQPLAGGTSFGAGRSPGGPSRWNRGKPGAAWTSVDPVLVCEVTFDHLQGERMRHAAGFVRWRPDRESRSCTYEQLQPPEAFDLKLALSGSE